jgi:protein-disulfide isomerase
VPDTVLFNECLHDPTVNAQLASDIVAGTRLGITVTPTFLINGTEFKGAPGGEALSRYIDRQTQSAPHGTR